MRGKTCSEMAMEYHKKHNIAPVEETYTHTYSDGSQLEFLIENHEKEVLIRDEGEMWPVNVMTNELVVLVRGQHVHHIEWFEGRKFRTVKSAIKAIVESEKGK